MDIIAHTMEYAGGPVDQDAGLLPYSDVYFKEYERLYNDSFREMRTALGLEPVNCCGSREALLNKKDQIFLLFERGRLAGSVSVRGNEIDDLIVGRDFRRKGYGAMLLRFAVSRMQKSGTAPIVLHVAGWNQGAVKLYLSGGFRIRETDIIKRT